MKKIILISAAMVATASFAAPRIVKADLSGLSGTFLPPAAVTSAPLSTRAGGDMQTLDFSYAGTPAENYRLNGVTAGKTRVYMAFEMQPDDIRMFAGGKVTGFTVYSPTGQNTATNTITDGQFFYSITGDKADYSQDFTMSDKVQTLNTVSLAEPYTITGEEESLFFGYSVKVPAANNMSYLPADGVPNLPGAGLYGSSDDGSFPSTFYTFSEDIGALCMSIVIEREDMPVLASFASVPSLICLPVGQPGTQTVRIKATSASPIESVTVEYSLGGNVCKETCRVDPAVSPGSSRYFTADLNFPAIAEKMTETVGFRLTEINGVANDSKDMEASALVAVVGKVPVHQTLFEEFTGTWCGWCPRGFASLEYIGKNYPEFVTASYHCGTYNLGRPVPDPMEVTKSFPVTVSGFPGAALNRNGKTYDPYTGSGAYRDPVPMVGDVLALNSESTVWCVSVSHEWESDDVLTAKAEVSNVLGYEGEAYKIAYILVADGLTSNASRYWAQSNYYSSNAPVYVEELNNFCRGGIYGQSTVANLVFNDVVVSTDGIYGVEGSVPATLAAEETAVHSLSFDLSNISSDLIPDRNKLRVIAAVLDKSGKVLNCAKDEVNDFDSNAVEGIGDAATAPVEYFNLGGMKVSEPGAGVYIRRQGSKAEKVLIP